MEGTNIQLGGGRRLVLAFDARCLTCSESARQIEEKVGDKLEVLPLHHPQVVHWREQALGDDAAWAPTLIEVKGGRVRAWTGLKMTLALGRRLGPRDVWRVMQIVGKIESAPKAGKSLVLGMNRGQFIKGLGGAALGIGLLSGPATRALAITGADGRVARIREKSKQAERAIALMEKHMKVAKSNTLSLNERDLAQDIRSGEAAGIDPDIFAELKQQLAKTNAKLRHSGNVRAAELLSTESVEQAVPESESHEKLSISGRCRGRTGTRYYWWGKRRYLDHCKTQALVRRLNAQAGAMAITAAFFPGFPTAVAAVLLAIGGQAVAGSDRGRGVYVNYIARIFAVRVMSQ